MTVTELYNSCLKLLRDAGIDNPGFELNCLAERFIGYNKTQRVIYADKIVDNNTVNSLNDAVCRRVNGEPLQYILGTWEFMGFEFKVGQGVLIPRPETELLVEKACEFLSHKKNALVYDLCAGSGAIGLSVAKLNPDCRVVMFEKYDEAFSYLIYNCNSFGLDNVKVLKYDVLSGFDALLEKPDLILSNPPYIKTEELSSLQPEVRIEPETALDGGADGLVFYRCLADSWFTHINDCGQLLVECADGQSVDIKKLFENRAPEIEVFYDFNNIDRVVRINV